VSENPKKKPSSGKNKVKQLGDFELKKKLGKGGMGEVYLARQVSLDRLVALKTLSRELAKKEDFVARFQREARSMAKIDHVNVVKVYAVDSVKGIHFAAIEFIDGQSVQDWLDHLGTFSVADAVHIALVSAEALRHAHEQNMVHRDIKPDNILLTSKGVVKVADFGLAKALDEDVSMTQSGTGLGTPLYMAPEQARSAKSVDQRCDIYALGATLYHMLTGELPFSGDTALELIMSKEKGQYTPARQLRSEVPERLDLIIDKMMAKDPAHRYKNCAEIIRDMSALGIHSETLSFIEGAVPAGFGSSSGPTVVSGGITVPGSSADSTASDSKRQSRSKSGVKQSSRTWFVQFEDAKKKMVVQKMSTGSVLKRINAGMLTAKAKCKASADGSYLPLAQFPEFADAIEEQLARKTAVIKKQDMQSLYKQVEKAEKRRYRWRWVANKFRGMVGAVSLIIWLALIGIVVWLGFAYGKAGFYWLGDRFNEMTATDKADDQDKDTDQFAE
jgi:serine/threonine-protein kinase